MEEPVTSTTTAGKSPQSSSVGSGRGARLPLACQLWAALAPVRELQEAVDWVPTELLLRVPDRDAHAFLRQTSKMFVAQERKQQVAMVRRHRVSSTSGGAAASSPSRPATAAGTSAATAHHGPPRPATSAGTSGAAARPALHRVGSAHAPAGSMAAKAAAASNPFKRLATGGPSASGANPRAAGTGTGTGVNPRTPLPARPAPSTLFQRTPTATNSSGAAAAGSSVAGAASSVTQPPRRSCVTPTVQRRASAGTAAPEAPAARRAVSAMRTGARTAALPAGVTSSPAAERRAAGTGRSATPLRAGSVRAGSATASGKLPSSPPERRTSASPAGATSGAGAARNSVDVSSPLSKPPMVPAGSPSHPRGNEQGQQETQGHIASSPSPPAPAARDTSSPSAAPGALPSRSPSVPALVMPLRPLENTDGKNSPLTTYRQTFRGAPAGHHPSAAATDSLGGWDMDRKLRELQGIQDTNRDAIQRHHTAPGEAPAGGSFARMRSFGPSKSASPPAQGRTADFGPSHLSDNEDNGQEQEVHAGGQGLGWEDADADAFNEDATCGSTEFASLNTLSVAERRVWMSVATPRTRRRMMAARVKSRTPQERVMERLGLSPRSPRQRRKTAAHGGVEAHAAALAAAEAAPSADLYGDDDGGYDSAGGDEGPVTASAVPAMCTFADSRDRVRDPVRTNSGAAPLMLSHTIGSDEQDGEATGEKDTVKEGKKLSAAAASAATPPGAPLSSNAAGVRTREPSAAPTNYLQEEY